MSQSAGTVAIGKEKLCIAADSVHTLIVPESGKPSVRSGHIPKQELDESPAFVHFNPRVDRGKTLVIAQGVDVEIQRNGKDQSERPSRGAHVLNRGDRLSVLNGSRTNRPRATFTMA